MKTLSSISQKYQDLARKNIDMAKRSNLIIEAISVLGNLSFNYESMSDVKLAIDIIVKIVPLNMSQIKKILAEFSVDENLAKLAVNSMLSEGWLRKEGKTQGTYYRPAN